MARRRRETKNDREDCQAIGAFTVGGYSLIVVAALLLPETKGHSLRY